MACIAAPVRCPHLFIQSINRSFVHFIHGSALAPRTSHLTPRTRLTPKRNSRINPSTSTSPSDLSNSTKFFRARCEHPPPTNLSISPITTWLPIFIKSEAQTTTSKPFVPIYYYIYRAFPSHSRHHCRHIGLSHLNLTHFTPRPWPILQTSIRLHWLSSATKWTQDPFYRTPQ